MDIGTALGIVGIVVSVIFGAWGIYVSLVQRMPGRITYLDEGAINLFDDLGRSVDGLSVNLNGNPVTNKLILLRGVLFNSGATDIAPEDVESPIELKVEDNFVLRSTNIVGASRDLQAFSTVENQKSSKFRFGLFRPNEAIRLNAVVEALGGDAPSGNLAGKQIQFVHRIKNTNKIKYMKADKSEKSMKRLGILGALMFAMFITIAAAFVFFRPSVIGFVVTPSETGADLQVLAKASGDKIEISEIYGDYKNNIPPSSFMRVAKEAVLVPKPINPFDIGVLALYGSMPLLIALIIGGTLWRQKKLRLMLSQIEPRNIS